MVEDHQLPQTLGKTQAMSVWFLENVTVAGASQALMWTDAICWRNDFLMALQ